MSKYKSQLKHATVKIKKHIESTNEKLGVHMRLSHQRHFIDEDKITPYTAFMMYSDGKIIEYSTDDGKTWNSVGDMSISKFVNDKNVIFRAINMNLKIEMNIPRPFTPKFGESYWFIDDLIEKGYGIATNSNNPIDIKTIRRGVWRTENEVKIASEKLKIGLL